MSTIRLLVAYDGTGFRGWARQRDPSIRTIGGELAGVLSEVLREDVTLSVAGRTDAGVHARGQVVSFETGSGVSPVKLQAAVNGRLAPEVVVREAGYAPDGFDARFSASAREYRYVVDTAAATDPFTGRYEWHRPGALSVGAMRRGARTLVGEHDFTTFCRHPGPGRSTVRDLQRLAVTREGERVSFSLRADAFLHQMVRSIVGTLVAVGEGRMTPEDVAAALAARDRAATAPVAPPHGLTLERVVYGPRR
ncbi:MAG: tRNA pseudouridine(38-40) synthase TruA [Actinomycetota bacterium]